MYAICNVIWIYDNEYDNDYDNDSSVVVTGWVSQSVVWQVLVCTRDKGWNVLTHKIS